MKNTKFSISSLYWENVDCKIVAGQRRVFDALGVPISQYLHTGFDHGEWMDMAMNQGADDEIMIFVDIDAVPLSIEALKRAISIADQGGIFGLAQAANHLSRPSEIYAGPVFFAIRVSKWKDLGKPSFRANDSNDVGQQVHQAALLAGSRITLAYPTACLIPMWPLSNHGIFGIGTFYENLFFHLFQSRMSKYSDVFWAVSEDVAGGNDIDYKNYLSMIHSRSQSEHQTTGVRAFFANTKKALRKAKLRLL